MTVMDGRTVSTQQVTMSRGIHVQSETGAMEAAEAAYDDGAKWFWSHLDILPLKGVHCATAKEIRRKGFVIEDQRKVGHKRRR